jgi:hypothetical protein
VQAAALRGTEFAGKPTQKTKSWSGAGETDSVYWTDFEKLGKEYASTLVKQLKKDKAIEKK